MLCLPYINDIDNYSLVIHSYFSYNITHKKLFNFETMVWSALNH